MITKRLASANLFALLAGVWIFGIFLEAALMRPPERHDLEIVKGRIAFVSITDPWKGEKPGDLRIQITQENGSIQKFGWVRRLQKTDRQVQYEKGEVRIWRTRPLLTRPMARLLNWPDVAMALEVSGDGNTLISYSESLEAFRESRFFFWFAIFVGGAVFLPLLSWFVRKSFLRRRNA